MFLGRQRKTHSQCRNGAEQNFRLCMTHLAAVMRRKERAVNVAIYPWRADISLPSACARLYEVCSACEEQRIECWAASWCLSRRALAIERILSHAPINLAPNALPATCCGIVICPWRSDLRCVSAQFERVVVSVADCRIGAHCSRNSAPTGLPVVAAGPIWCRAA
jgi:hypothetical protein